MAPASPQTPVYDHVSDASAAPVGTSDAATTPPAAAEPPLALGSTRLHLKYPITINGKKHTYLDLRRPKARDLLHADRLGNSDGEKEIIQFASISGHAPKDLEELDAADYLALQKKVQSFFS